MTKPKPIPPTHCQNCGAKLDEDTILKAAIRIRARLGGKVKGESKVRDHATLSAAAKRRWERYRAEKAAKQA